MEEDLKSKSVRELKAILAEMRVSATGCFEKGDLVERIVQARKDQKKQRSSGKPYVTTLKGLKCIVMETDPSPELLLFIFHGFGANAENLADIGVALLKQGKIKSKKIKIIVANAPLDMGGGSYAWWPLNLEQLMMKMFTQGIEGLFKGEKPKEFKSSTTMVQGLLADQMKATGLPMSKVCLCGFSQGSWLATHLALEAKEQAGAVVLYSSALYCDNWATKVAEKKGMRVVQFHGTQDPVLPYQQGQMLKAVFEKGGCTHSFHTFQGGHNLPQDAISKLDDELMKLV